jgi:hypothetical protein
MIIGVLSEGDFDERPLQLIIRRLVTEVKPDLDTATLIFRGVNAGGEILSKMSAAAQVFFDTEPKVDIAVFLSDVDKFPERKKEMDKWIEEFQRTNASAPIIPGTADPVFENWYFIEENALKSHLNLSATSVIPFSNLKPKPRLRKLIDEFSSDDPVMSRIERYVEIARLLNFQTLSERDPKHFGLFRKNFQDVCISL